MRRFEAVLTLAGPALGIERETLALPAVGRVRTR